MLAPEKGQSLQENRQHNMKYLDERVADEQVIDGMRGLCLEHLVFRGRGRQYFLNCSMSMPDS